MKETQASMSKPVSPPTRYWLMSAGGGASEWAAWNAEGVATIDYPEVASDDLRQYESREKLKQLGLGKFNSLACWQFCREMKPGDVIIVKKNRMHVIGHGVVTSDYRFDERRPQRRHRHVRGVKWLSRTDDGVRPRERLLVTKTLTDITDYEDQVQGSLRALEPFTHSEPDQRDKDQKRSASIHPLNLILYGPPGTGKTWHAVTRAVAIVENRKADEVAQEDRAAVKRRFDEFRREGRIAMVTFHQNTTYEEFIEGIRPVLDAAAGDVRYKLSRGVFRQIAERAQKDPAGRYVLIIDEINRGNVARIFGELITLIEDSKRIGRDDEARAILPGSQDDFGVPANLHVVGTMNTADRSIALLDTALRRRFVFEERMPDPTLVSPDAGGVDCRKLLAAMNDRIAALLDREHRIGHTYFLRVDTVEALAETFRTRIVPLLQEYFYDDWEKIRAVLNWNGFVKEEPSPKELLDADLVDDHQVMYELLPADDPRWNDPRAYRRIYEPKEQAGPAEDSSEARND